MALCPAVRMQIGICLIVLFAILSDARMAGRAVRAVAGMTHPDEITRHEARFRQLKQVLPPTSVGYVTDRMPEHPVDADLRNRLAFKRYVLTQYTLLPAVVFPGAHGPLVVGDFYSADGLDSVATRGLRLVRDFGDGVMLFRTSAE